MPFVLTKEKIVKWPVYIDEPANGGQSTRRKIVLDFLIVDPATWEETGESVNEALLAVIKGWEGIENPDHTSVEFCDENLDALLKIPYVRAAIWQTYLSEVVVGGIAKN